MISYKQYGVASDSSQLDNPKTDDSLLQNPNILQQILSMMNQSGFRPVTIQSQDINYIDIYHQLSPDEFKVLKITDIAHAENNKLIDGKLYFISQDQLPEQSKALQEYRLCAPVFNIYNDNIMYNYNNRKQKIKNAVNLDSNYLVYRYIQQKNIYELIGMCSIYSMKNQLEVSCSYGVLSRFHKQGLGTRILQLLEALIRQRNTNRQEPWNYMVLLIDVHNIPSYRIAEKCGFKRIEAIFYARDKIVHEYIKDLNNKQ